MNMMLDEHAIAKKAADLSRVPPHCVATEAAVLGTLLDRPDVYAPDIARLGLNRNSFHDLRHRRVFDEFKAALADGLHPDEILLARRLREANRLEDAGGLAYLCELANSYLAAGLFEMHVNELHKFRARRELI